MTDGLWWGYWGPVDQLLTFGNPAYWGPPLTIMNELSSLNPMFKKKNGCSIFYIVTNDVETVSTYQLGTSFSGCLVHVDHLYWKGTTYYYPLMRTQVLWTQMLFPTLSVPNISFPWEPLCKILQGTKVLQNFIGKYNHTLIEHSAVITIAAKKLIDIGIDVQKHTNHSWWDVFFTKSPTVKKFLPTYVIPCFFDDFCLTIWICGLTCRVKKTAHVILPYSYAVQPKQFWGPLLGKLKWRKSC